LILFSETTEKTTSLLKSFEDVSFSGSSNDFLNNEKHEEKNTRKFLFKVEGIFLNTRRLHRYF
jgi:hypothetical protein